MQKAGQNGRPFGGNESNLTVRKVLRGSLDIAHDSIEINVTQFTVLDTLKGVFDGGIFLHFRCRGRRGLNM